MVVSELFTVPAPAKWETAEAAWIAGSQLAQLELLGAFRLTLLSLGLLDEAED